MKPDEFRWWRLMATECRCPYRDGWAGTSDPREMLARHGGIHRKRLRYLLEKWAARGLYEWGVNIDLGWLTLAGSMFADRVVGRFP